MKILFAKGNRLYTVTWIVLIVGALGHSSAQLPEDDAFVAIVDSLEGYTLEVGGGMSPTLMDVVVGAWLQIGFFMVGISLLHLVVLVVSEGDRRIMRAMLWTDLVFSRQVSVSE